MVTDKSSLSQQTTSNSIEESESSRRDEPLSAKYIEKLKSEYSSTMSVIDPDGPQTGVYTIFLPWEAIYDTQGLKRLLHGMKPHPSLCMLYQKGKCRAYGRCNQVHAQPSIVNEVRRKGRHDCCMYHGDPPSNDQNFISTYNTGRKKELLLVTGNKKKHTVSMDKLARTACLDKLVEKKDVNSRPLKFYLTYVCRLHQEEKCRYGQDCHHIHICREFFRNFLQQHPSANNEYNGTQERPPPPKKSRAIPICKPSIPEEVKGSPEEAQELGSDCGISEEAHDNEARSMTETPPPELEPDEPHSFKAPVIEIVQSTPPKSSPPRPPKLESISLGPVGPSKTIEDTSTCNALHLGFPEFGVTIKSILAPEQNALTSPMGSPLSPFDPLSPLDVHPQGIDVKEICINVEGSDKSFPVSVNAPRDTLADVRQRLPFNMVYVFVVDNDVITNSEERYLRASRVASCRVMLRLLRV